MLIDTTTPSTPLDGLSVAGGTPFVPIDDDAAIARYESNGYTISVVYESGRYHPYLSVRPPVKMPEWARDEKAWNKFIFDDDDDRMLEFEMDSRDGEIKYLVHEPNVDEMEREIAEAVQFCGAVCPKLIAYIADKHEE